MGLFSKKEPETGPNGYKKHFTNVIKNSGTSQMLIWRQPEEDFNTNSTLIVMPGEEALFIKGGNVEAVFTPGTYKLSTENYPFITRLRTVFSGGVSTFNCVVYFINKTATMEIKWGTQTPIQVRDPVFQIMCDVGVRGTFRVEVADGHKFLNTMVGNNVNFYKKEHLMAYFRSEITMHVKSNIVRVIQGLGQELIGINAQQDIISKSLGTVLNESLEEYGIHLRSFVIESIDVIDNENRRKLEAAIAKRGEINILGSNYLTLEQIDIMKTVASKSGGQMSPLTGIGVGMGMGKAMGNMMTGMFSGESAGGISPIDAQASPLDKLNNPAQNQMPQQPMQQQYQQPVQQQYQQPMQQQYQQPVQQQAAPPANDYSAKLEQLKAMYEANQISKEVYDEYTSKIMSQMFGI